MFLSVLEAIDVLLKITYVFNLEFNAVVVPMWDFLGYALLGLPLTERSSDVENLVKKLDKWVRKQTTSAEIADAGSPL